MNSIEELAKALRDKENLLVITGAGISVDSGIPTYRDDKARWQRSDPIQHQEFIDHYPKRQRYWARSCAGWPMVASARPNASHHALSELEKQGRIRLLVTQNVDRLHQQAGHKNVIDLHGRLDRVLCRNCGQVEARDALQQRLVAENPILEGIVGAIAPDGDADVADTLVEQIRCPECLHCGGMLMPDVVFFGGSVPKPRVEQIYTELNKADALLLIGSSLTVFSAYRFCKAAQKQDIPMYAINRGQTRADDLLDLKIEADCSYALTELLGKLSQSIRTTG